MLAQHQQFPGAATFNSLQQVEPPPNASMNIVMCNNTIVSVLQQLATLDSRIGCNLFREPTPPAAAERCYESTLLDQSTQLLHRIQLAGRLVTDIESAIGSEYMLSTQAAQTKF